MDIQELLGKIRGRVKALEDRQNNGEDVADELAQAKRAQQTVASSAARTREGSKHVGQGADAAYLRDLIDGDGSDLNLDLNVDGVKLAASEANRKGPSGSALVQAIAAAGRGDQTAFKSLTGVGIKGWVEGTPSAGGFLVPPEQLPGYLEQRRASSPLRERCAHFTVNTDEVWVALEGDSVTVQHVAEAATKPDSTGTVSQKVSTVFKLAGTSHISDELLRDTNGVAGELVARQFGTQIGIEVDKAILSGNGTGQPTGIRNAAGVTATPVIGQDADELADSVLKALGRLRSKFYTADTVAIHPRDLTKFDTAKDADGRYLWPNGLGDLFGDALVVDANIPTNLGGGTNESVILVGEFQAGAFFFEREPLRIDASQHAGWQTNETVYRGEERYGFAVVRPAAFEVLTGITP